MQKKNPLFPIIIGVISLLTIYTIVLHPLNVFGFLSIIIGVVGILFYYKDNRKYLQLFYVWVFIQIPNIFLEDSAGNVNPILSAFPGSLFPLQLNSGLNLGLKDNSSLVIYFNFLPVGLYFLLKYLTAGKLLGLKVSITLLRKGAITTIPFPLNGTITSISDRTKTSSVYFIQLDNEIQINTISYNTVILIPKDNSTIRLTTKKQICRLRLPPLTQQEFSEKVSVFVDWAVVEVK